MKKSICCLLSAFSICSMFAFGSCQDSNNGKIELTYGEKYIYFQDVGDEEKTQSYFLFNKDGTAQYYYYWKYKDEVENYTLNLIYEAVPEENTIFCFFDSIEYADDHNRDEIGSYTTYTILCSQNVVMTSNGAKYIAESYLEKIPNFNK